MNLIDCTVTKVLEKPHLEFNKYFMRVEYTAYGRTGESTLMFDSKNEADSVKPGYKFLA